MIKITYKGININMPYDLLESIMVCEGLDEWLLYNTDSNFIINTVV